MPERICLPRAVPHRLQDAGRWQCLALTGATPGDPPTTGGGTTTEPLDPLRCPVCGHDLADGVLEISTEITERRRMIRTTHGWAVREVAPECFGETWYACPECGQTLPAAIGRRIAAEL